LHDILAVLRGLGRPGEVLTPRSLRKSWRPTEVHRFGVLPWSCAIVQ